MITPEQKAKLYKSDGFLQQAGVREKTPENMAPVSSEDLYKQLMNTGVPKVAPVVTPVAPKVAEKVPEKGMLEKLGGKESMLGKFGEELGQRAEKVVEETKQNFQDIGTRYDIAKAKGEKSALPLMALSATAAIPKAVTSLLFESAKQLMPGALKKDINAYIKTIVENPNVQKDVLTPLSKKIEENPKTAQAAQDILDIIAVLPAAKASTTLKEGLAVAGKEATLAAETVSEAASKAKQAVKPVIKAATEKVSEVGTKKAVAQAAKSLTPDVNAIPAGEYTELVKSGKIIPKTTTKPAQYVLDESEKALTQKYPKLLKTGDPVKDTNAVMNNLSTNVKKVEKIVDKYNAPIDRNKLTDNMLDELTKVASKDMNVKEDEIIKMVKDYQDFLKEGDVKDLFSNRNSFTTGRTYEGMVTTQKKLDAAARRGIVKTLKETLPEEYASSIDEMKDMYDIAELLEYSSKAEKGKSGIQAWMKANPGKAKALKWGIGITGTGAFGSYIMQ